MPPPAPEQLVSNTPPPQPTPAAPVPQPTPAQSAQPGAQPNSATQPQNQPQVSTPSLAQPPQDAQQPSSTTQSNVSNLPPAAQASIQRAGILRTIAETLAGGPRYQVSIDPATGATTRTQLPLSGKAIGWAIASEVLSGAMSGLSVKNGLGNEGRAAAAGFQQEQAQRQQADLLQQQQAQTDLKNQTSALAAKAAAFETNSRTVLNTAQSERMGIESLKDAVSANAELLAGYEDQGAVQESHVSQDALTAGMKNGTYGATQQIAVPDGWTNLNGRYEQTFSIVQNPSAKVQLTDAQAQAFGDAGIPGWLQYAGGKNKVPNGFMIPGSMIANANQQLQAIGLMKQDVAGVVDTLSKSSDKGNQALAKNVPNIQTLLNDPDNGPTLQAALMKLQKYVSHSNMHGLDFAESLKMMASPSKPNPQNPKQFIPNPDANAAQVIAGAFGNGDPQKGWQVLTAYHDAVTPEPIKNVAQAESIVADKASTPREVIEANKFLALDRQQKAQAAEDEARARKGAEGTGSGTLNVSSLSPKEYGAIIDGIGTNTLDASQMLRYGKADQLKILADVKAKYPQFDATQYQANLGLAKWATSGKGGDQIQALNTLHAHAQDFNENVNALGNTDSSLLNTPINAIRKRTGNPNIVSTLGRLLAVRTEYMNVLNNNHALSVEDKADADTLMNENQSPQQWLAALNQITHTADLRGAETNARYKATFGKDMPNYRGSQSQQGGATNVVPPGATPGRDATGRVIGYRTADGKVVRF